MQRLTGYKVVTMSVFSGEGRKISPQGNKKPANNPSAGFWIHGTVSDTHSLQMVFTAFFIVHDADLCISFTTVAIP
jgi:hypothetical protein